jgi:uncharacterized protein YjbI with pentapeptide repeats
MYRAKQHIALATAIASLLVAITGCAGSRIERFLKSQNLVGINLSGTDAYNLSLEGLDLTRARLVRAAVTFCNLKKSKFVNADLRWADLSASDLGDADLRGANLRGSTCHNTSFRKAVLIDAYFYDADLSGADLRGAVMEAETQDGVVKGIAPAREPGLMPYFAHFRNANMDGAAVSARWKIFIKNQGVRNYDRIIWSR